MSIFTAVESPAMKRALVMYPDASSTSLTIRGEHGHLSIVRTQQGEKADIFLSLVKSGKEITLSEDQRYELSIAVEEYGLSGARQVYNRIFT